MDCTHVDLTIVLRSLGLNCFSRQMFLRDIKVVISYEAEMHEQMFSVVVLCVFCIMLKDLTQTLVFGLFLKTTGAITVFH